MASPQVIIRDQVYNAVAAATLTGEPFVGKSYYPRSAMADIGPRIHVWVVTHGHIGARERQDRCKSYTTDFGVSIAVQNRIDNLQDVDYVDTKLMVLLDELMDLAEADFKYSGHSFLWNKTDFLRDPNNLPYSYEDLSSLGVFNAIFTTHYRFVKSRS